MHLGPQSPPTIIVHRNNSLLNHEYWNQYALNVHIPSGEGICTCVVQYFSMVLYNDFLGQIVPIGLLNSCVSVSTCITCPYTHIRYIAQMPSPEGICTIQLRDSMCSFRASNRLRENFRHTLACTNLPYIELLRPSASKSTTWVRRQCPF